MFRSATIRQDELTTRRFHAYMDHWKRSADQWFDGTVASVEERIAKLDRVISFAREVVAQRGSVGAGFLCISALPNLEQSRRELAAARASLLNGFSDRQAGGSALAGRRTANTIQIPTLALAPTLRRAVDLGSRDFLAGQNTEDREELLIRARRYAADETSTLPVSTARAIAAAFVGKVEELIAQRLRKRQAAALVTHYEDFADQLLY